MKTVSTQTIQNINYVLQYSSYKKRRRFDNAKKFSIKLFLAFGALVLLVLLTMLLIKK